MIVGWDAGHGGANRGCYVKDYGDEAAYVMMMARRIKPMVPGSILLRSYDQTLSLYDRAELARANNCDLVVSLHVNAAPGNALHGLSVFAWPGNEQTEKLGRRVLTLCPPELTTSPEGTTLRARPMVFTDKEHWKRHARAVLRRYHCDALLVEVGFGAVDHEALNDRTVQDKLCAAIAQAIKEVYHGDDQ